MTLLNGLFDSSVMVFLVVKKGCEAGTDLHLIFLILTCLTIFLWLRTYLLLPRKIIPFPLPPGEIQYGWKEIKCCKSSKLQEATLQASPLACDESTSPVLDVVDANHAKVRSFMHSLKNILMWTNIFHYSVITLRLSFQINSLLSWLRSFADPSQVSQLTDDLGFILMFGAVVAPINGLIIDGMRKLLKARQENIQIIHLQTTCLSLLITSFLSIIVSIMALVLSPHATFVFTLLTRSFVHGSSAAFLANNFPFKDFGKLCGITSFATGAVGLLQYALFQLSLSYDPTFYYINIGFLIATILSLFHPIAILIKTASIKKIIEAKTNNSKQ